MRTRMATETGCVNLLGRCFAELKNFGRDPPAVDVCLSWPVAAFASDPFAAVHQRKARMRIRSKVLGHVSMADHAGIRADIAGSRSIGSGCLRRWRLSAVRPDRPRSP